HQLFQREWLRRNSEPFFFSACISFSRAQSFEHKFTRAIVAHPFRPVQDPASGVNGLCAGSSPQFL
ncbi:hypothetical protein, partial [Massilia timonae]|uniref:hypothetical protein n=1 Tax=Massilia timonae TaxID=47229 RepID=UPI0028A1180C